MYSNLDSTIYFRNVTYTNSTPLFLESISTTGKILESKFDTIQAETLMHLHDGSRLELSDLSISNLEIEEGVITVFFSYLNIT